MEPGEDPPALLTGQCAWPSITDHRLVLSYLAPTTAQSGSQHLEDVLATGTGFASGGRVITQAAGAETVGILLDDEEMIREVAVVRRSALLYLIVDLEVSAQGGNGPGRLPAAPRRRPGPGPPLSRSAQAAPNMVSHCSSVFGLEHEVVLAGARPWWPTASGE